MSSQLKPVSSQSRAPFKNEKDDQYNQTENISESPQDRTYAEPNTKPTANTHQNLLQSLESSCSEIFIELVRNSLQSCNHKKKLEWYLQHQQKVPAQQVSRSEFLFPTPFIFHVITRSQKLAFITDANSFGESLI